MDQVVAAMTASAVSNATVHISRGDDFFMHYKPLVTELYNNLSGVQQFQIFTMERSKPGVVQCRKGPDSEVEEQDLRRKIDGVLTEASKVERMFAHFLTPLPPPPINAEKVYTMHHTVRKYVPDEFQSDPMYSAPTRSKEMPLKRQSRRDESTELQWQWLQRSIKTSADGKKTEKPLTRGTRSARRLTRIGNSVVGEKSL
ncbi:unnamed protein product [Phytophthora fragariaefolia]|uniref:Unnamed protein product n=1 Tax=Phytophthora fragariaefolia TaxID=1490495 RepID=A0A9W6Y716_9STRA|nr:unnamed protein product [Phytophthora fragariaefolia]